MHLYCQQQGIYQRHIKIRKQNTNLNDIKLKCENQGQHQKAGQQKTGKGDLILLKSTSKICFIRTIFIIFLFNFYIKQSYQGTCNVSKFSGGTIKSSNSINLLKMSQDYKTVVTVQRNGLMKIWKLDFPNIIFKQQFQVDQVYDYHQGLFIWKNGQKIFTAGIAGNIRIFNYLKDDQKYQKSNLTISVGKQILAIFINKAGNLMYVSSQKVGNSIITFVWDQLKSTWNLNQLYYGISSSNCIMKKSQKQFVIYDYNNRYVLIVKLSDDGSYKLDQAFKIDQNLYNIRLSSNQKFITSYGYSLYDFKLNQQNGLYQRISSIQLKTNQRIYDSFIDQNKFYSVTTSDTNKLVRTYTLSQNYTYNLINQYNFSSLPIKIAGHLKSAFLIISHSNGQLSLINCGCNQNTSKNCYLCSQQNGTCFQCETGYYLKKGNCFDVSLPCVQNCQVCDIYYQCQTCKKGYYKKQDLCIACNQNCNLCTVQNQCDQCAIKYFLSNSTCFQCSIHCSRCQNQTFCLECDAGFIYRKGSCCYEGTSICDRIKPPKIVCQDGYYINRKNLCSKCKDNCTKCKSWSVCEDCEYNISNSSFNPCQINYTMIDQLGKGINLISVNPFILANREINYSSIFNLTFQQLKLNADKTYLISDQTYSKQLNTCSSQINFYEFRGTKSYQQYLKKYVQVDKNPQKLLQYAFSATDDFIRIDNLTKNEIIITHATAQCNVQEIQFQNIDQLQLTQQFKDQAINAHKNENWTSFINKFGSHFIQKITLGARIISQVNYQFKYASTLRYLNIDRQLAGRDLMSKNLNLSISNSSQSKSNLSYTQMYKYSSQNISYGEYPQNISNTDEWIQDIVNADTFTISKVKLNILSELFTKINDPAFDANSAKTNFQKALSLLPIQTESLTPTYDFLQPLPFYVVKKKSNIYGKQFNGKNFTAEPNLLTMQIKKIYVQNSSWIQQFEVYWSDGYQEKYSNISKLFLPNFQKPFFTWQVPENSQIKKVQIASGYYIDYLKFYTNSNTSSLLFGGNGGYKRQFTIPQNYKLIGFFGNYDTFLHQLGLIMARFYYPKCKEPFQVVKQKQRQICKARNCIVFNSQQQGNCSKCSQLYELNYTTKTCQIKNCVKFNQSNDGSCIQCNQKFQLINGGCFPMNCFQLQVNFNNSKTGNCSICSEQYQLNNVTNRCQVQNCKTFDAENMICLDCNPDYELIAGFCKNKSNVSSQIVLFPLNYQQKVNYGFQPLKDPNFFILVTQDRVNDNNTLNSRIILSTIQQANGWLAFREQTSFVPQFKFNFVQYAGKSPNLFCFGLVDVQTKQYHFYRYLNNSQFHLTNQNILINQEEDYIQISNDCSFYRINRRFSAYDLTLSWPYNQQFVFDQDFIIFISQNSIQYQIQYFFYFIRYFKSNIQDSTDLILKKASLIINQNNGTNTNRTLYVICGWKKIKSQSNENLTSYSYFVKFLLSNLYNYNTSNPNTNLTAYQQSWQIVLQMSGISYMNAPQFVFQQNLLSFFIIQNKLDASYLYKGYTIKLKQLLFQRLSLKQLRYVGYSNIVLKQNYLYQRNLNTSEETRQSNMYQIVGDSLNLFYSKQIDANDSLKWTKTYIVLDLERLYIKQYYQGNNTFYLKTQNIPRLYNITVKQTLLQQYRNKNNPLQWLRTIQIERKINFGENQQQIYYTFLINRTIFYQSNNSLKSNITEYKSYKNLTIVQVQQNGFRCYIFKQNQLNQSNETYFFKTNLNEFYQISQRNLSYNKFQIQKNCQFFLIDKTIFRKDAFVSQLIEHDHYFMHSSFEFLLAERQLFQRINDKYSLQFTFKPSKYQIQNFSYVKQTNNQKVTQKIIIFSMLQIKNNDSSEFNYTVQIYCGKDSAGWQFLDEYKGVTDNNRTQFYANQLLTIVIVYEEIQNNKFAYKGWRIAYQEQVSNKIITPYQLTLQKKQIILVQNYLYSRDILKENITNVTYYQHCYYLIQNQFIEIHQVNFSYQNLSDIGNYSVQKRKNSNNQQYLFIYNFFNAQKQKIYSSNAVKSITEYLKHEQRLNPNMIFADFVTQNSYLSYLNQNQNSHVRIYENNLQHVVYAVDRTGKNFNRKIVSSLKITHSNSQNCYLYSAYHKIDAKNLKIQLYAIFTDYQNSQIKFYNISIKSPPNQTNGSQAPVDGDILQVFYIQLTSSSTKSISNDCKLLRIDDKIYQLRYIPATQNSTNNSDSTPQKSYNYTVISNNQTWRYAIINNQFTYSFIENNLIKLEIQNMTLKQTNLNVTQLRDQHKIYQNIDNTKLLILTQNNSDYESTVLIIYKNNMDQSKVINTNLKLFSIFNNLNLINPKNVLQNIKIKINQNFNKFAVLNLTSLKLYFINYEKQLIQQVKLQFNEFKYQNELNFQISQNYLYVNYRNNQYIYKIQTTQTNDFKCKLIKENMYDSKYKKLSQSYFIKQNQLSSQLVIYYTYKNYYSSKQIMTIKRKFNFTSNLVKTVSNVYIKDRNFYSSLQNAILTCSPGCIDCVDGQICRKCANMYNLETNYFTCYKCKQFCRQCSTSDLSVCLSCFPGYTLKNSVCVKCHQSCFQCKKSNQYSCSSCKIGKYLVSNDANSTCQNCPDNCENCSTNTTCSKCSYGFTLNQAKLCMFAGKCLQFNGTKITQCIQCQEGYFLNNSSKECIKCINNCRNCAAQKSCSQCDEGYILSSQNKCIQKCKFPCLECSLEDVNKCLGCITGYKLVNFSCQNDLDCNKNGECSNCPLKYSLIEGKCYTCTDISNCNSCHKFNLYQCLSCADGYYLNNNQCSACHQSCQTCILQDICITCKTGYFLNEKAQKSYCLSCNEDVYHCKQCIYSAANCLSCQQNYLLKDGICLTSIHVQFKLTLELQFDELSISTYQMLKKQMAKLLNRSLSQINILQISNGSLILRGTVNAYNTSDQKQILAKSQSLVNGTSLGNISVLSSNFKGTTQIANNSIYTTSQEKNNTILILAITIPGSSVVLIFISLYVYLHRKKKSIQKELQRQKESVKTRYSEQSEMARKSRQQLRAKRKRTHFVPKITNVYTSTSATSFKQEIQT